MVPEQHDIAKQAQFMLRTKQSYINVLNLLFLQNHDFNQNRKVMLEILYLATNVFGNRGFEQMSQKQPILPYVQRSLDLTKYYRENFATEAQYDQIIIKLTQLITAFCHHVPFRKLVHGDLFKNNILQYLTHDVEVTYPIFQSSQKSPIENCFCSEATEGQTEMVLQCRAIV